MHQPPHKKQRKFVLGQAGYVGYGLLIAIMAVFGSILFRSAGSQAVPAATAIKTKAGYCLDDRRSVLKQGAKVDVWGCNGTSAQAWMVNPTSITRAGDYCLDASNGPKSVSSAVVLNRCDGSAGQVWLRQNNGFLNPDSRLCLAFSEDKPGAVVGLDSCGQTDWRVSTATAGATTASCSKETKGERVACFAALEWNRWQSPSADHNALLNVYTDGAPYEEWCADFVSYVYKEAGYPFSGGEADGWDESNANLVQNMGFSMHDANGYVPKAGDVAYFNYQGGHVEIVVSGGKKPSFIYGNSATIDPSTGNGQMEANTITSDGWQGKVIYYLSPDY